MSKCDIKITFHYSDRTYRGGEVVSGEAHITVNKDIRCDGIILSHYWKTHGRGDTDRGVVSEVRLSEMLPLQAGEELRLPFEFTADCWPLSYHGHYLNVDHYVHVAVDLPWAIDPKQEEEFILIAGQSPDEFTGERTKPVDLGKKPAQVSGIGKMLLYLVLAIFVVVLGSLFVILIPVFLVGGAIYWGRKMLISSRVGDVDVKTPHLIVGPGEVFPVELSFTPRRSFSVNGVTLKIIAEETARSGSGTNSTTHRHILYDETYTLYPAGRLMAGERFAESIAFNMPNTEAWSFMASDNSVTWSVEIRIDIPRFPDWTKRVVLQFVPLEFLDHADFPAIKRSSATAISALPDASDSDDDWSESDFRDDDADITEEHGSQNMGPLLDIIADIRQAGRIGNEREEIIESAVGQAYHASIVINRISPTLGFVGDDRRYEDGTTIIGKLLGTNNEVQLFTVEATSNSAATGTRGETIQAVVYMNGWDSLYDRLVLHELPFD